MATGTTATEAPASIPGADAPPLMTAEFLRDPYPAWAYLRRHAPVHFSPEWNAFLLTRYSDVVAGFRDARLSSNRISAYAANLPPVVREQVAPLITHFSNWILFADAPMHTRVRGLINRAFVPRLIESMRSRLEQLVTDHLAQLTDSSIIDVVHTLGVPLPVLAIGEMLGLPASDRHLLKGWSDMLAAFLGMRKPTPEFVAQTIAAIRELERYFRDHLAQRRRSPPAREDLLTALLSAEDNGALLSEQELLSTCSAVLFGGHETTTNLIGNCVWLLARFPEVQAELRRDPSAIPAVVEETLRYESPVQRMGRVAGEDFELHGQRIQKGQVVWLVMGAANRDAEHFANADSFLPRRSDNRHLAFGIGSHFCIGAALGRLEAQLAVGGLLRALPEIRLADEPLEWIDNLTVHGLKRLPLERR